MSALSGTRLLRPSSWVVVLVLVAALLAPLVAHPPAAEAVNCPGILDGPCDAGGKVIDGVGDAGNAAVGVIGDVGGVLGDAVGGAGDLLDKAKDAVAGKVSDAWEWSKGHVDDIVKAAAGLGIAVGTWVLCSKVAKAVTVAASTAAGGAASGGTAALPSAVGGAALAHAACQLVKKGGKLLLRYGPRLLRLAEKLKGIAKKSSEATGLAALFYGTQHAAAWVLANVLVFDEPSAPQLADGWLTKLRSQLDGLAGILLLLATILGLMLAVVSGRLSDVGRVFSRMVGAALIIGVVGALLLATLQMSDEVTSAALGSKEGQKALGNWKDLGDVYADVAPKKKGVKDTVTDLVKDLVPGGTEAAGAGTPTEDGKGPWVVRLLIALATAICAALVKLEMVVRDALLYLLLVFGGLLLSSYPFPSTRHIAQRFGMTLLGIVVAKPVIVISLLIGGRFMQSAADAEADAVIMPMLQGAGLLALSAFLGWSVLAWFNVQGVAAFSGIGSRLRGGAAGDDGGPSAADGSSGESRSSGARSSAADPVRALARSTGDRVDGGAGEATGAGPGGGRIDRLRAREQAAGTGAESAAGPGGGGGSAGGGPDENDGLPAVGGGASVPSRATGTTSDGSSTPGGGASDASSGSGGRDAMSGGPAPTSTDAPGGPAPGAGDTTPGFGGADAPGRTRGGGGDPAFDAPLVAASAAGGGAGGAGAMLTTAGGLPVVPGGSPGAPIGAGGGSSDASSGGGPGGVTLSSSAGPGGGGSGPGGPSVGPGGVVAHHASGSGSSGSGAAGPDPSGSAPAGGAAAGSVAGSASGPMAGAASGAGGAGGLPAAPSMAGRDSDGGFASSAGAPSGDERSAPVLVAAGAGAPPDPVDAFGSHSSSVRQMLDAHDDALRGSR